MRITLGLIATLLLAGSALAEHSGKVLETMNSGGYTYVKLDAADGPLWLAGPESKVSKGQTITTDQGSLMTDFTARSLNRTFEKIWFVSSISGGGGAVKSADPHAGIPGFGENKGAMGGMGAMSGSPKNTPAAQSAKPKAGSIAKAGVTIADLYAKKDSYKGKTVEVRGVVTKYSGGIMGKNWLHIMDGSGAEGADDLSITTQTEVHVGDQVVVKGTLNTAVDVGAGYFYDLLVENASVTVESK
ncbi:MAG: hypothetical protein KDC10_11465 [Calditrichaeota bacterium]|nr:hypothetical protein [Candidatus Cloacimonadota bacterium]MCB1047804.1 hypothetical protein [Calditrichota bacterium]MCB9474010.1 hypothetical protein [Candidatus Delongbacteria bacterium]